MIVAGVTEGLQNVVYNFFFGRHFHYIWLLFEEFMVIRSAPGKKLFLDLNRKI